MIDRIAKLLNKAERAATAEEAASYFEKAQALATAHSISLAKARLHTDRRQLRPQPVNRTVRIGEARRHVNRHLVLLMASIARANDLKMDIAHNSTYVVLFGFADDIDAAEALWSRIATQMVRFGEEYLNLGDWRQDARVVLRDGYAIRGAMTKQTARATYYRSFIETVGTRVSRARRRAVREAEAADTMAGEAAASANGHPQPPGGQQELVLDPEQAATPGGTGSTALALRAKAEAVGEFYAQQSRARGSWGGARPRVLGLSESAEAAGRRDAQRVSLADATGLPGAPRSVEGA